MRKIAVIAAVTIRQAVHSRLFAAGLAALAIIIIGLPFIMQGDGSPESLFFIFVNYAFGLLMFVLSLLAAWSGAGAIALDIAGRQMQLLTVKPLRAIEIWTGKLLGLMIINLILLALGGGLLYAMLQWSLKSAPTGRADQADWRREIMTVYRAGPLRPVAGRSQAPVAVDPGRSFRWRFDLARQGEKTGPALLKFRFVPAPFAYQSPVAGTWRVFDAQNQCHFSNAAPASPHRMVSLFIPARPATGPAELEYLNRQTNPAVTVFFPSENDLQLLIPAGRLENNLLRALIMTLARLCFFTALGLLAGTLFSFPVAVLAAMGLLAAAFSGGLARQLAERGFLLGPVDNHVSALAAGLNALVCGAFQFLTAILPPLDRFDPLAFLPNSLLIPWRLVGQALGELGGVYSLILILAGAIGLARREIALPRS